MRPNYLSLLVALFFVFSCSDDPEVNNPPPAKRLELINAFPLIDFDRPVDLQQSEGFLYVVEQKGVY